MTKEKIYIPFRMVNYENEFIDHRGILYIIPYLIEGRFNNEIGMDLKYTLLKYKFCNETSMVNNSDLVIAVWNGSKGGTNNCIDYAKKKNKDILYINMIF